MLAPGSFPQSPKQPGQPLPMLLQLVHLFLSYSELRPEAVLGEELLLPKRSDKKILEEVEGNMLHISEVSL